MLPSLSTVDQLEDKVGQPVDEGQARLALAFASAVLRTYAGITWVDSDGELADVPDVVELLCLEVAYRRYTNPDGYASEQIGQYSYRISAGAAGGFLTPAEKQLLTLAVGSNVHSLHTPRSGLRRGNVVYVADGGGGDPIPWHEDP